MLYVRLGCTFLLSLLIISLTGCAFNTREVTLRNSELDQSGSQKKVHSICFNGLKDNRPDTAIGHVQNGYGVQTAKVIALNSVPEWVNTEIENKLQSAGYNVLKDCSNDGQSFIIDGSILKIYTTAYFTYLGEVTLKASVKFNNTIIMEREYSEHEKSGTNWAATTESFRDILEHSLKSTLSKFVHDIDSLDKEHYSTQYLNTINSILNSNNVKNTDTTEPELELEDSLKIECPSGDGKLKVVKGEFDLTSISYTFSSIKADLKAYYRERFELNSALKGSICVYFEINRQGRTENIRIIDNTINDNPISERLVSQISEKHFGKLSDDQSRVGITYRLVFSNESAKSSKQALGAVFGILAVIPLIFVLINTSRMTGM